MSKQLQSNNLYRVEAYPNKGVNLECVGMTCIDEDALGFYDSIEDLPKWAKNKVALLLVTSAKPPTEEVEGVGQRMGEYVFWIYKEEDNEDD